MSVHLKEEETYISVSNFVNYLNHCILYIGNNYWHNKENCEENDRVSTSSKQKCNCCKQNQNICGIKEQNLELTYRN